MEASKMEVSKMEASNIEADDDSRSNSGRAEEESRRKRSSSRLSSIRQHEEEQELEDDIDDDDDDNGSSAPLRGVGSGQIRERHVPYASWPLNYPHPKEDKILTVICKHDYWYWCLMARGFGLHEEDDAGVTSEKTTANAFSPEVYWR
jgi:hypothetical protein